MNPCIKTGAVVLFKDYGLSLPADIYQIGTSFVIRTHANALNNKALVHNRQADYEVRSSPQHAEFWRDDLGVFVVEGPMFRCLTNAGLHEHKGVSK